MGRICASAGCIEWKLITFEIGIGGGEAFSGKGFEFATDEVGRETGSEKRAIDGGEFFVAYFSPSGAEFALDALADDDGFVVGFGGFGEGVVNVAIGDAAGAKVSGDAELALFADFCVGAGELPGVAGIVELAGFFEACENDLGEEFGVSAADELRFHFVDGVSATHEDAEGVVVKVLLGVEFAGARQHKKKMR
jgi:hypothetical protein